MPTAFDRLLDVLRALRDEGVDYVLFGRQAVNLHGLPRSTEDIDLFVRPTPENVDRLRRAIDLVSRIGEAFAFDDIEAEELAMGNVAVRVATPRMLYEMQKGTVRPIDHADAADLKAKFSLGEDD